MQFTQLVLMHSEQISQFPTLSVMQFINHWIAVELAQIKVNIRLIFVLIKLCSFMVWKSFNYIINIINVRKKKNLKFFQ